MLFPAIGLLLYIAFLLVAFVLSGIIWGLCSLILWLMELKPRSTRRKPPASSRRNVPPVRDRAEAQVASDIWPKWTASHRRYMDHELSLWQEQFDALSSRE